ncbi:MAG: ACT domain-containing protein [Clostridia bacterium]|nr:ACT domain-containing protein [Clostridia bacterium]MBR5779057.1 ACT domain-containing protein [Clostridia bacterium]
MYIKQLSVFVENKDGRLAEITTIIANAGIDIRALSIADTTDFGILRLVVDKPYEAEDILKAAGLTVSLTDVIAIGIPDRPGGFAETITAVANKAVAVEYMYAFISREQDRAYLIMRVADNETAIAALRAQGCDLLDGESVYQL